MPIATEHATRGKITEAKDGLIVFNPRGTTYQLHLKHTGETPTLNQPVDLVIRAMARKVWTVPSGGNFITPIVGPSKIVQGRVKSVTESELVVQAGANFVIALPKAESAVDLPDGSITVGRMVNVTLLPGASAEV
jgi:hypothetical protein